MNEHILENAIVYVKSYVAGWQRRGMPWDYRAACTLRDHVTRLFGAEYAIALDNWKLIDAR